MIVNFKIYEEFHEKDKPRLQDLPFGKIQRRCDINEYKYKIDDIVTHIELGKVFIIKSINDCSDNQDYFIINPVDTSEKGFVIEEELRDAKPDEKEDAEAFLSAKKYNI